MKKSKSNRFFKKYINGTKGVISLFLAILMVPFTTIAGSLINAGRINSAVAIFDEALCNASNSALGTYDAFIRQRFGLMAMSQDTSDGGSRFGYAQGNYTADKFVNDLFAYYMEQNLGILSNTYSPKEIEAIGLYPLSDPAVLKNAVSQSGGYASIAKSVIEWGSLDDMINNLTKSFRVTSSLVDTVTGGSKVVESIDDLSEKQEALEKKLDEFNKAKENYDSAYKNFISAASSFNKLVNNIHSTKQSIDTYTQQITYFSGEEQSAAAQVSAKEKDVNSLAQSGADQETIDAALNELEELRSYQNEMSNSRRTAESNLSTAKNNLASYENQFPQKRKDVIAEQSNYESMILKLRDEVNKVSSAVIDFQNAIKTLVDSGVGMVKDVVSSGVEIANYSKKASEKELNEQNEYYRYQETLAQNAGRTDEATYYHNLAQENNLTKEYLKNGTVNNSNISTIAGAAESEYSAITNEISNFALRDLTESYQKIYNGLESTRVAVNGISVPTGYSTIASYDFYFNFTNPIEKADIATLIDNLEKTITESAGWAVLNAMVEFIKAMLDVSLLFDSKLTSSVDTSLYSSIGGLPSKKSYPILSQYDQEDAAQSEAYKEMLNSYADETVYYTDTNYISKFEQIVNHINAISNLLDPFKLKNLKALWDEATGLASCMDSLSSLVSLGTTLYDTAKKNVMMISYVSYNTANRTTYSGKALTGAAYNLPPQSANQGYAFSGAETEYILMGSTSEVTNQVKVFFVEYVLRLLSNISAVSQDATVHTLAATIAAATFGICGPLTYIVADMLESLVDTFILVGGGEIPIVKSYMYITPTGIPKLLEQVLSLSLNEMTKKKLYEGAAGCADKMNERIENYGLEHGKYVESQLNLPSYPDNVSRQEDHDAKFQNKFTINYTKSLQLMMFFFPGANTITRRLSDIIQMEAAYNAKSKTATYMFNLDKSYTYLRASGSFDTNFFMKIDEADSVSSKKRVIYNGY